MLRDYASFIAVLAIVTALYIPTLAYPTSSDSTAFAMNAKYYAEGDYSADVPDPKRLPLFSVVSIPLAAVTGSYMLGIKLAAFVFGIITVAAWLFIGKELFNDTKWFPFLISCPLLILYALFRPLADAPLICFSLLSVLFLLKAQKRKEYFYLSGLFFSLAVLSSYIGIFLGAAYLLIFAMEKRRPNKEFAIAVGSGFFVVLLVLLGNLAAHGSILPGAYAEKISGESSGLSFFTRPLLILWLQMPDILLFLGLSLPLLPFFVKGFFRLSKKRDLSLILLFLVSLGFGIVSGSAFRYLIMAVAFFLMISFAGFSPVKNTGLKWVFLLGIAIYLVATPYFVNGQAKELADSFVFTPPTWGQDGLRYAEAAYWMKMNLPQNSIIVSGQQQIWDEYTREDLTFLNYLGLESAHRNRFYFLYDRTTPDAIDDVYVYPNGTAERFGQKPEGLETEWDFLKENYAIEPVFQSGRAGSLITLYRLTPNSV